jgi:hypothetical protein
MTIPGCSKWSSSEAASESKPVAYPFSPALPELPRQLSPRVGYVEDFDELRTKLGAIFSSRHTFLRMCPILFFFVRRYFTFDACG